MEKKVNNIIYEYVNNLKTNIKNYIQNNEDKNDLINYIDNLNNLVLSKEDFVKRKRSKNFIPVYERCNAKRANNERCTRRKKEDSDFCGTHIKGQPNGIINDDKKEEKTFKKILVKAQEINGIIYYIDDNCNVYNHFDILNNTRNPQVVSKYSYENGVYTIQQL